MHAYIKYRKMVTDQNRSSDSSEIRALKKQLEDYRSQHNTLERRVKRLEIDVEFLKIKLDDLDECVDMETVFDLIHKIVPSLINKKSKGSSYSFESESSEESESVEIIEGPHRVQLRSKKAILHRQRIKVRPRRVKLLVV